MRQSSSWDEQLLVIRVSVRRRDCKPFRNKLQQVIGQYPVQHLPVQRHALAGAEQDHVADVDLVDGDFNVLAAMGNIE